MVVGNYFGLLPYDPEKDIDQWFFGAAPPEVKANARPFRIPRFFRTLSQYVNALIDSGFSIERMDEPYPGDEALKADPGCYDNRIVPYFLLLRCRKKCTARRQRRTDPKHSFSRRTSRRRP